MAEVEAEEPEGNGTTPEVVVSGSAQASVCWPCLAARGVMLLAASALLVWIIIQERKRAKSG